MHLNPIPHEIAVQVADAQEVLARHLGEAMHAVYLFGSAVDGDLRPLSDVDLMAVVDTPLTEGVRRGLMQELLQHSAPPGRSGMLRPLELTVLASSELIPWRYPARRELQFGEWLREDLAAGTFEQRMLDHDLAILITKLRGQSVALRGPPAAELFDPVPTADFKRAMLDTVAQWRDAPDWRGDERNIVLALARLWFSADTGAITAKDLAADWAVSRLPEPLRPLMRQAASSYLSGEDDGLALRAQEVSRLVHFCKQAIEKSLRDWA